MLDDFREQANSSPLFNEDENLDLNAFSPRTRRLFLGMTPAQRFVIAVMLLAIVCLLGTFFLLVTEKIVLPPIF
jgi:hypothetical protein